jgi:hypothetical protein
MHNSVYLWKIYVYVHTTYCDLFFRFLINRINALLVTEKCLEKLPQYLGIFLLHKSNQWDVCEILPASFWVFSDKKKMICKWRLCSLLSSWKECWGWVKNKGVMLSSITTDLGSPFLARWEQNKSKGPWLGCQGHRVTWEQLNSVSITGLSQVSLQS